MIDSFTDFNKMRFDFKAAFHQVVDNPDPNVYFLSEMKLKLNESIDNCLVSDLESKHATPKQKIRCFGSGTLDLTISK